jgi:general secretion pathway protein F
MPVFRYTALSAAGQNLSGELEAETREAVVRHLSAAGHFPVDVTEAAAKAASAGSAIKAGRSAGSAASNALVTSFTRQVAMMLTAGLPLAQAMTLIASDRGTKRLAEVAARLKASMSAGKGFAESLEAEPALFPPVFVSMVKAGEASGTLAPVLDRIASTREREAKLKAKIQSALIYPGIVIVTAVAMILLMMLVVVPRFKSMLGDQGSGTGSKTPDATRFIFGVSDFLIDHGAMLGLGILAAAAVLIGLRQLPAVRRRLDQVLLRMPLVGPLIRMSMTIRFCRTIGTLLAGGVQLPQALNLTRDVMGNETASEIVGGMSADLRKGVDLTARMQGSWLFPPIVVALIRVGEETGRLSTSALYLADVFEERLDVGAQRLISVLNPAIMLVVSGIVGGIIVSIMSAVIGVYDVIL